MEIADLIVVNKADGDLLASARQAQVEYMHALQLSRPRTAAWKPKVLMASTLDNGESVIKVWAEMDKFHQAILVSLGHLVIHPALSPSSLSLPFFPFFSFFFFLSQYI